MRIECGGLLFTSDFDSGNLDKVEYLDSLEGKKLNFPSSITDKTLPPITNKSHRRQKSHPESPIASPVHSKKYQLKKRTLHSKLKNTVSSESLYSGINKTIREFKVWTKPDCSGTPHQTTFRTWFYFGISGGPPGVIVKLNVMNLNRQGKLYFHGMKPVFKIVPSKEGWKRIPGKVDFRCATDGNFIITFSHTLPSERDSITYFAFTYPFSYSDCQKMLDSIDEQIETSVYITKNSKPADNSLYYCRELLCYSTEGNRIELLTVTSCKGLTAEREKKLPDLFPDNSKPRCHIFQNKKIVFISSRVHPGETPSSFVLNGMLKYLLKSKDSMATRLRNLFVFKFIPLLNPDGVLRGHYRADVQGLNLNRIYMVADFQCNPSIYAARTLILHYHTVYSTPEDTPRSNKTQVKKSKSSHVNINLSLGKSSEGSKKPSRDFGNQMQQRKVSVRKHSLHTCDTLTRSLNFLSSVPVVLPVVSKSIDMNRRPIPFGKAREKPFELSTASVMSEESRSGPMDDLKQTSSSPGGHCSECKFSDYPSKKVSPFCQI